MNDFGLDLAVIGNGRTAALLEPASRLVWWCYPRFDGDPVFVKRVSIDDEGEVTEEVTEATTEADWRYRPPFGTPGTERSAEQRMVGVGQAR